jgi:glycosyltransferase involved in cell wall biosynthesis
MSTILSAFVFLGIFGYFFWFSMCADLFSHRGCIVMNDQNVQTPPPAQGDPASPQRQGGGRPHNRPHHQRPQQQRPQQQWPDFTVVIPLYNEEGSLKELHHQIRSTFNRINARYELIFVDDGSTDTSFNVLRDLRRIDRHIRIVRFRRNYGKSAALAAGFEKANGTIVVTMDADLQDDPGEIPALAKKIEAGYDLVSGWKRKRKDPLSKTIPSKFFNVVTGMLTGIRIHDFNCGLKAYRRDVVKSVHVYGELHRYVPVLAHWEGFRVGEMPVVHRPRKYGKTKFGVGRFWKGFLDLLTTLFITRYLKRPMHLFGLWGLAAIAVGVIIDGWLAVEWFLGLTSLSNRPLFLAGFVIIIVGIQFMSIGLLGEMLSRTRSDEREYSIREFIR